MNDSLLNKLSKYGKEKNYKLDGFVYKFERSNLPDAFYEVIIDYIKSVYPTYNDNPKIENFEIVFTKEKSAYFKILTNDKLSTIIILDDNSFYRDLPRAKVIRQSQFLLDVKAKDNQKYEEIFKNLPDEFIRRFIKDSSEIKDFEAIIDEATKRIIRYADYLEEASKLHTPKIYFQEADPDRTIKSKNTGNTGTNSDRKNDEIPFEERERILDSYGSNYEFDAESTNTSSTYKIKVYKIEKKKYRVIMEPLEGTKYTKIVFINGKHLSSDKVKTIVIDSLQLDRSDISQREDITRHSHTDLQAYKSLLDYVIRNNGSNISSSAKRNIDIAGNIKR